MSEITYASVKVGDVIPALTKDEIIRTTLGLFAGASGDHNPIHIDIDFARAAGMEDVFAHGETRVRVAVRAVNQDGDVKLAGDAVVALP